jgi:ribosomal protein S18 acetylase RimI-like enzyme
MIREIAVDELDIIDDILARMSRRLEGQLPPDFKNQIRKSVSENKSALYCSFNSEGHIDGIAGFGKVSQRIAFVFADNNQHVTQDLVSAVFNHFSQEFDFISVLGPFVDEATQKHLMNLGFCQYDRAKMSLDREKILKLKLPELPDHMTYEVYNNEQRASIADVVYKGNVDNIDGRVFPGFFGTLEATTKMLKDIESSRYGDYKEPYSWVLRDNGSVVGACFMTIRNGDTGYIPDIVITPDYQGKGLGRRLLLHSMKELLKGETDIVRVNLDVTLENRALLLYESFGFEVVQKNSVFVWAR